MSADPRTDQIGAATSHARGVVGTVSELMGKPLQQGMSGSGPVQRLLDRWGALPPERRRPCRHLDNPQPVHAFLALLGDVICMKHRECLAGQMDRYFAAIGRDRCDACAGRSDRFREMTMQNGPIMFSANVCDGCFAATGASAADTADSDTRAATAAAMLIANGMCPTCNATSRRGPHPLVKGLTVVEILHDDWCPVLAR